MITDNNNKINSSCAEVWGAIGPEEGRLFHLSLLCSHCTWTDNNMYIFKIHID